MSESIGALYPTLIPSLSDTANIQEAIRLYHYGDASYNPSNTNPSLIPASSVAGALNSLQGQITSISGTLGIQASTWTAKGVLVTATAASTVSALTVGTNGQVLTANSATSTGLQWSTPEVLSTNVVTLTNKTIALGSNTVSGTIAQFNTAVTDADFATLAGVETLTNKTLTSPTINTPTVTGLYLSDSTGIVFEGSGVDANEITINVVNPTADRTINFPDNSGTVALLADTHFIGTTSVALNRASANLALTGISSIAMPGSTSGTITLQPTAIAGTNTITLPASTGTVALTSSKLSDFAATTSAELAGVLSDETGFSAGAVAVFSISPALTGTPTAPTAALNTNTTQIATTAYAYQIEDFVTIALSDEITNITVGTNKVTWRAPFAMTLTQIPRASLATASSSGLVTVDINETGVSVLGTNKLSIDATEKTSVTAATPTTLADTAIADDSEITFDIDAAGTGAKGLKVTLYYKRA